MSRTMAAAALVPVLNPQRAVEFAAAALSRLPSAAPVRDNNRAHGAP